MPRFRVLPERSKVWIESRSNLHPVHAEGDQVVGFVEAEVSGDRLLLNPSPRGRIEVPVERLRSGNALYDRELLRRIDARRYPTIVGEIREVRATDRPDRYRVVGDLSFHGVTRTVEGEVTVRIQDGRLVIEGEQTFDVRDFGIEPPRILMLRVYPDVKVRLRVEATPEG